MNEITEKMEESFLERLSKTLNFVISLNVGFEKYEKELSKDTRLREDLKIEGEAKDFFNNQVEEEFSMDLSRKKMQEFETIGDYVSYLYKEEIFGRR